MSTFASVPAITRSCSSVANSLAWRGHRGGRAGPAPVPRPDPLHLEIAGRFVLIAETQHADGVLATVERGEFARQVLDVNARAAVDVRRIFIGEHSDIHGRPC